ncbi:DUF4489 domain-containing protein [Clostridium sp. AWRP]|uniref:DUF4489 domain-containing protein n=1 Tax=Clostridium sp. AWRP TaxID=2212991 RepID=UPI000FD9077D|nr:DUF4489 domain-containing protein [Clostridium sp. AWRP]AZV56836.1 DUF4489 domain-containing protein [Clostridium sp. AWRP]
MNSMSRYYYKDDCDPCSKENYDPCKSQKIAATIIKCGCPNSITIPVIAATTTARDFTLASLTLDTRRLKNPCIKLEFASNPVAAAAFTGSLSFQVFKQCGNQITPTPIGPAWAFSEAALIFSQTFSFFVCDCDCSCFNGCCTYTVVATVTSAATTGTLAINNALLGAIVTSSNSCCQN